LEFAFELALSLTMCVVHSPHLWCKGTEERFFWQDRGAGRMAKGCESPVPSGRSS